MLAMLPTRHLGAYTISDDPGRLELTAIHAYLRRSYWSPGIPLEVVERAVRGALCIGALLQGLRRWSLVTADAHDLYRRFGFTPVAQPERHMERLNPDIYRSGSPKR